MLGEPGSRVHFDMLNKHLRHLSQGLRLNIDKSSLREEGFDSVFEVPVHPGGVGLTEAGMRQQVAFTIKKQKAMAVLSPFSPLYTS